MVLDAFRVYCCVGETCDLTHLYIQSINTTDSASTVT